MSRGRLAAWGSGAIAAGVAAALLGSQTGAGTPSADDSAKGLPAPVRPAFTPGPPRELGPRRFTTVWAPVRRTVSARRRPARAASPVAVVGRTTSDGTTNVVLVVGHRTGASGRLWIRVAMPTLPNGRTGWVPRSALGGYGTVDTHLVVDLRRFTATLLERGRPVFHARVGVGQSRWPTPRGRFYVRDRLTRYASPTYGPIAFGTSARSETLTDWPGGGYVGIHGTDQPSLIPGRISHGCIRMRNADILRLARRMPVGTPITVR
jgi:lipoprotein-anchoring transpeptidase ErfK/SrfK